MPVRERDPVLTFCRFELIHMKTTLKVIVIGFLSGLAGSYAGYRYFPETATVTQEPAADFHTVNYPAAKPAEIPRPDAVAPSRTALAVDFSEAAARATPSVVYINSISQGVTYSTWDWVFGEAP